MLLALQLAINGVAAGALYAFVALGFALIYNATGILHLAHGAAFALGGYAFYAALVLAELPIPISFILAICASALFGILIEIIVYRRLRARAADHASDMIASLGVLTLFQALFGIVFGTDNLSVRTAPLETLRLGDVHVTTLHLTIAVLALLVFCVLQFYLARSRLGRAIRASADNPRLTRILGVNAEFLNLLIFGLGSGLAGVAGCLISFDSGVRPDVGFSIMFIAITAVIVGGVGYLPGAAIGGLVVGLLQSFSLIPLTARWQDVCVFGLLVLFLLLRPQGVFGHTLLVRKA